MHANGGVAKEESRAPEAVVGCWLKAAPSSTSKLWAQACAPWQLLKNSQLGQHPCCGLDRFFPLLAALLPCRSMPALALSVACGGKAARQASLAARPCDSFRLAQAQVLVLALAATCLGERAPASLSRSAPAPCSCARCRPPPWLLSPLRPLPLLLLQALTSCLCTAGTSKSLRGQPRQRPPLPCGGPSPCQEEARGAAAPRAAASACKGHQRTNKWKVAVYLHRPWVALLFLPPGWKRVAAGKLGLAPPARRASALFEKNLRSSTI